MKIPTQQLINDLISRTKENITGAELFLELPIDELNWRNSAEEWSVLECYEHLNRYSQFYIPAITQSIQAAKPATDNTTFKSGWLGNYFANSMLPKEKLNKMKTFTEMNPAGSQLDKDVLVQFLKDQQEMIRLLESARKIDLTKNKTGISISKYIRLRLGDTFRVVIYHNYRHLVQAQNVKNESLVAA